MKKLVLSLETLLLIGALVINFGFRAKLPNKEHGLKRHFKEMCFADVWGNPPSGQAAAAWIALESNNAPVNAFDITSTSTFIPAPQGDGGYSGTCATITYWTYTN